MTTLWENSSSSKSSNMLTIYLLIFAGIYQLHEAGATTRKSLNCQVFTLYLIYNNTKNIAYFPHICILYRDLYIMYAQCKHR